MKPGDLCSWYNSSGSTHGVWRRARVKRITTNRVVITLENSTDMSRATRAVRPGSVEHGWKRAEDYERGARWKLC